MSSRIRARQFSDVMIVSSEVGRGTRRGVEDSETISFAA
jgi:hypothetical protein